MAPKQRADVLLVERGWSDSREKAGRLIMEGEVTANGQLVDKPGMQVALDVTLVLRVKPRFVSRGGDKLDAALSAFSLDVGGKVCADVGASTGGFTDCLLQRGAAKVYAIDVGYGQLDYRLRKDERVVVMEQTNARYVETLLEPVTIVTIDASFISLRLLLPVVKNWLVRDGASVIPLIKPQFEAGKADVGKGGVVKAPEVHRRVVHQEVYSTQWTGYTVPGLGCRPRKSPSGKIKCSA